MSEAETDNIPTHHLGEISTGDYLVVKKKGKNAVAQVFSVDAQDEVNIVYEKNRHDPEYKEMETVGLSRIVANLGPEPEEGANVFGTKLEPFKEQKNHKKWGDIFFFRTISDDDKSAMKAALKHTYSVLEKKDLLGFLPIEIHVRPKSETSKKAGSHQVPQRKKGESRLDRPDIITLFHKDGFNADELTYVMFHEVAHGMEHTLIPSHIMTEWIELYNQYISVSSVEEEYLSELREHFENTVEDHNGSFKAYRKKLDAENEDDGRASRLFDGCLDYMKRVHKLEQRDVALLLLTRGDLSEYWPEHISVMSLETVVSEYATKNPHEFWAEAFAMHMTGVQLPQDVEDKVQRTLSNLDKSDDGS